MPFTHSPVTGSPAGRTRCLVRNPPAVTGTNTQEPEGSSSSKDRAAAWKDQAAARKDQSNSTEKSGSLRYGQASVANLPQHEPIVAPRHRENNQAAPWNAAEPGLLTSVSPPALVRLVS